MPFQSATVQNLRSVFQSAFAVRDVAEPLASFDHSDSAETVREHMTASSLEVAGVRCQGRIQGFVERQDLQGGTCDDAMQAFQESDVILDSAPIADLILLLKDRNQLFVSVLGCVGGLVTRADLQKPPIRMWLFGMVTLIEMRFGRLIETHCQAESWREFVSQGRLEKANSLLSERARRNQDVKLLDCLQLSDKAQIVARNERLRNMTRFQSRRKLEEATKKLESLRNNLAHSQDIMATDWETIVLLAENLDRVLDGPQGLREDASPA